MVAEEGRCLGEFPRVLLPPPPLLLLHSSGEFRATFLCLESHSLSDDRRPIMFVRRPKLESVGRSALNLLLFQLNSVT